MATKKRKLQDVGLVSDLRKSLDLVHEYLRHSHGSEHVAGVFKSNGLCFGCHRSKCVCQEDDEEQTESKEMSSLESKLKDRESKLKDRESKLKDRQDKNEYLKDKLKDLESDLKNRNKLIDDLLEQLRDLNYCELTEWFEKRGFCEECYDKTDDCNCQGSGYDDDDDVEEEEESKQKEKGKEKETQEKPKAKETETRQAEGKTETRQAKTEIKKSQEPKISCPDCRKNLIVEDEQYYCDVCNAKRSDWKFTCLGCYEKLPKPGSYHSTECEQQDLKFIKSTSGIGICGMSVCHEKGFKRHPESKRILCENCYKGWVLNDAFCQKMSREYQVAF